MIDGEDPKIDSSVWDTSKSKIGHVLKSESNEFGLVIHIVDRCEVGQAVKPENYEKSALIVESLTESPSTYDPSNPTRNVTRDLVAGDFRGIIAKGNMAGRSWPLCIMLTVEKGGDGLMVGCEIDNDNSGSFQPELDKVDSKYGQLWVGGVREGNQPLTADVYIYRGTAGHHRCFVMREDAFAGRPDDAFFTLLYAGTNKVKHQIGPDGLIIDGRKVIVRKINGYDCLTLE